MTAEPQCPRIDADGTLRDATGRQINPAPLIDPRRRAAHDPNRWTSPIARAAPPVPKASPVTSMPGWDIPAPGELVVRPADIEDTRWFVFLHLRAEGDLILWTASRIGHGDAETMGEPGPEFRLPDASDLHAGLAQDPARTAIAVAACFRETINPQITFPFRINGRAPLSRRPPAGPVHRPTDKGIEAAIKCVLHAHAGDPSGWPHPVRTMVTLAARSEQLCGFPTPFMPRLHLLPLSLDIITTRAKRGIGERLTEDLQALEAAFPLIGRASRSMTPEDPGITPTGRLSDLESRPSPTQPREIRVVVHPPTGHERARARRQLKAWLAAPATFADWVRTQFPDPSETGGSASDQKAFEDDTPDTALNRWRNST